MKCKTCPNEITPREKRLNAGLCDTCFGKAARLIAKEILKREKNKNN